MINCYYDGGRSCLGDAGNPSTIQGGFYRGLLLDGSPSALVLAGREKAACLLVGLPRLIILY